MYVVHVRLLIRNVSDNFEKRIARLEKLVNERPDRIADPPSILPPTQGQRRLALAIVLALLVAFLVMLPFARMELPAVHSFVPTIQMALLINDLFTSARCSLNSRSRVNVQSWCLRPAIFSPR